jgi:hypothetical protein
VHRQLSSAADSWEIRVYVFRTDPDISPVSPMVTSLDPWNWGAATISPVAPMVTADAPVS